MHYVDNVAVLCHLHDKLRSGRTVLYNSTSNKVEISKKYFQLTNEQSNPLFECEIVWKFSKG